MMGMQGDLRIRQLAGQIMGRKNPRKQESQNQKQGSSDNYSSHEDPSKKK
jgi:hypothetical protein